MTGSNYISELPSCESFGENDLFVVSQQDKYIKDKFNTRSIVGKDLVDVIFNKILDIRHFGSMAFAQSSDFSLYDHKHDDKYNNISLDFAYDASDANVLSIGNVFSNGSFYPLNMPQLKHSVKLLSLKEPKVGTLKFVALASIGTNSSISYKSPEFDGWLYPDGSTFSLSDFALSDDIAVLYGNNDGTFTLPDIRRFIKASNEDSNDQIALVENNTALQPHTHLVDIKCNGTATVGLMLPSNRYYNSSRTNSYGGRVFPGCGYVAVKFTQNYTARYKGKDTTAIDLLKEFTFNNNCGINKFQWVGIDDLKEICNAIDAKNGTTLHEYVTHLLRFNLPPIDKINFNAKIAMQNDIDVGYASSKEDDETYPTHVILPVMIYVGQSRR